MEISEEREKREEGGVRVTPAASRHSKLASCWYPSVRSWTMGERGERETRLVPRREEKRQSSQFSTAFLCGNRCERGFQPISRRSSYSLHHWTFSHFYLHPWFIFLVLFLLAHSPTIDPYLINLLSTGLAVNREKYKEKYQLAHAPRYVSRNMTWVVFHDSTWRRWNKVGDCNRFTHPFSALDYLDNRSGSWLWLDRKGKFILSSSTCWNIDGWNRTGSSGSDRV